MKTLKDSILEKLSIDDINLNRNNISLNRNFPIDGTLQDIVKFLENNGFEKVSSSANWEQTFKNYRKYNTKAFGVEKGVYTFIEIIDRSNSKFKNKLFYIKLNPDKYYKDKYNIFDDITTAKRAQDARLVSKEDFLKELSEIL